MALLDHGRRRAVIVVSSHVMRGAVGNRAAVFALETLGFPVWAVPTVVMPWHPGHGPSTRMVPEDATFETMLAELEGSSWLSEVGGVLSGYLGDPAQARSVASLVKAVKARNPEALYLCDPVIGDANGLYVPEETAQAIRDQLLPLADITTPNRFELGWLAGRDLTRNRELVAAAREFTSSRMLITSCHASLPGGTGNLLLTPDRALLVEHEGVEHPPHGPGDLMAALFLGQVLSGETDSESLRAATASVLEVLTRSVRRGDDELALETEAHSLVRPAMDVVVAQIPDAVPAEGE